MMHGSGDSDPHATHPSKGRSDDTNGCLVRRKEDRNDRKRRLLSLESESRRVNTGPPLDIDMEFIELIKVPKLDNVTITMPAKDQIDGSICITGHHLIFSSRKAVGDELWVSLLSITCNHMLIMALV